MDRAPARQEGIQVKSLIEGGLPYIGIPAATLYPLGFIALGVQLWRDPAFPYGDFTTVWEAVALVPQTVVVATGIRLTYMSLIATILGAAVAGFLLALVRRKKNGDDREGGVGGVPQSHSPPGTRLPHAAARFRPQPRVRYLSEDGIRLRLRVAGREGTRAHYPFAFGLGVGFDLSEGGLMVTIAVENPNGEPMPADVGFHPGFNWPLTPGRTKDEYAVVFDEHDDEDEPAPVQPGGDDPVLLYPDGEPTSVEGHVPRPRDELFAGSPIVFDRLKRQVVDVGRAGRARLAGGLSRQPAPGPVDDPGRELPLHRALAPPAVACVGWWVFTPDGPSEAVARKLRSGRTKVCSRLIVIDPEGAICP